MNLSYHTRYTKMCRPDEMLFWRLLGRRISGLPCDLLRLSMHTSSYFEHDKSAIIMGFASSALKTTYVSDDPVSRFIHTICAGSPTMMGLRYSMSSSCGQEGTSPAIFSASSMNFPWVKPST